MSDIEILIARLTIFLEEHGAYDRFITNLDNYEDIDSLCEYEINCDTPEDAMSDGFSWGNTIEGAAYWSNLYDEFCNNYDSLPTERPEPDPQWNKMWEE